MIAAESLHRSPNALAAYTGDFGWASDCSSPATRTRPGLMPPNISIINGSGVGYGLGHARFAGSTYDPTSHYRASAVFAFFKDQGLSPKLLRQVSQHQLGLLTSCFDRLDADPDLISRDRALALRDIGGFLVLRSPFAAEICRRLKERSVYTDSRADALRLGPAPLSLRRPTNCGHAAPWRCPADHAVDLLPV
jgi:hypothetical protein